MWAWVFGSGRSCLHSHLLNSAGLPKLFYKNNVSYVGKDFPLFDRQDKVRKCFMQALVETKNIFFHGPLKLMLKDLTM